MPEISDMFPHLDYDTLNKSLNFMNFDLTSPGSSGLSLDQKMQDGVVTTNEPASTDTTVEVSEEELPQKEEWEKLSMSQRIERVKQQAPGMPIVSVLDIASLKKLASKMEKKGMYRESAKIFRVAESFSKSIQINETNIDGKREENANVSFNSDKDGQPINIQKTFESIEEALKFYEQFPELKDLKDVEKLMNQFKLLSEGIALRRFMRKAFMLN